MTGIGFSWRRGRDLQGRPQRYAALTTAAINLDHGRDWHPGWDRLLFRRGARCGGCHLVVLALFLALERKMPAETLHVSRGDASRAMPCRARTKLRKLIASHGFAITHLTEAHARPGSAVRIPHGRLHGRDPKNAEALSRHLRPLPGVIGIPDFADGD